MSDIEQLLAIEEIKRLHARRDRYLDTRDWDALEALHVPEHRTHAVGVHSASTASEAIANTRRFAERGRFAHQSYSPEISFESPTKASGIWAMRAMSEWTQGEDEHWFEGYGHYIESYEKRNGEWLFTSREEKFYFTRQSPGSILSLDAASD
jgi:hypothetical protein